MSGSISFSCLRFRSGGFFASCCATLSPQNVSTDCTGKGEEEAGRQGRGVGGVGWGGGSSQENGPGPRPALPWPSNGARTLTTCVYSMRAQMADRFRGLLCFLSFCFLLLIRGGSSSHLKTGQHRGIVRGRTQARARTCTHACTQLRAWRRSISALSLLIIFSAGFQYEA